MRTFVERTQEDLDKITRRTTRSYTDGEVTLDQHNDIMKHLSQVEEVLRDIEENNGE